MAYYLLLPLTFVLVALFANQQVSAAAVGGQQGCIDRASDSYNSFKKTGCSVNSSEKDCRAVVDFAIKNLNTDLDRCGSSGLVTLCRIVPGSFLESSSCSYTSGGGSLSKADCEAQARNDYTYSNADGSTTVFQAKNAKCIHAIDYDCKKLC